MIIQLDAETMKYIKELVEERDLRKRTDLGENDWMVSKLPVMELRIMGLAAEWIAAVALGCLFNPFYHTGGDGDKGDLTCNGIDISVKGRNHYTKRQYIIPSNAKSQDFLDKFGVLVMFTDKTYSRAEVVGYFNADDFAMKKQTIIVGGVRNGFPNTRIAICEPDFRPIEELAGYLDGQVDEDVVTAQTEGYLAYFRAREAELRAASESAHPTRRRNQEKQGSKCQASIGERIRAKYPALRGATEQD
jgi:hypothetical protein